jgi:hypothetical protein
MSRWIRTVTNTALAFITVFCFIHLSTCILYGWHRQKKMRLQSRTIYHLGWLHWGVYQDKHGRRRAELDGIRKVTMNEMEKEFGGARSNISHRSGGYVIAFK